MMAIRRIHKASTNIFTAINLSNEKQYVNLVLDDGIFMFDEIKTIYFVDIDFIMPFKSKYIGIMKGKHTLCTTNENGAIRKTLKIDGSFQVYEFEVTIEKVLIFKNMESDNGN